MARDGTSASAAVLAPAMAVIGLGMGAAFGTLYGIAIGDIDPAEAVTLLPRRPQADAGR